MACAILRAKGAAFAARYTMLKITKFGGSSLASATQFQKVKQIVTADPARKIVVVSAAGKRFASDNKLTDLLYLCYAHLQYGVNYDSVFSRVVRRYEEIRHTLHLQVDLESEFAKIRAKMDSGISQDELASRGEYLSALLMADYLGYEFLDAADFLKFQATGQVDMAATSAALLEKAAGKRCVIPGFYGVLPNGHIKTFTRGGSDVTGAIVAAVLGADVYENWTDVPGILMADPRIVDDPKPLDHISYSELRELSYIGTQVLHEDTIAPVREKSIPINIRNTNAPELPGTMICSELPNDVKSSDITGVFGRKGCTLLTVRKNGLCAQGEILQQLFAGLSGFDLPVLHFVCGIDQITLLLSQRADSQAAELFAQSLKKKQLADAVQITQEVSVLATLSRNLLQNPAIAGRVLNTLSAQGIPALSALQCQLSQSFLTAVPDACFEQAIRALYQEFVSTTQKGV